MSSDSPPSPQSFFLELSIHRHLQSIDHNHRPIGIDRILSILLPSSISHDIYRLDTEPITQSISILLRFRRQKDSDSAREHFELMKTIDFYSSSFEILEIRSRGNDEEISRNVYESNRTNNDDRIDQKLSKNPAAPSLLTDSKRNLIRLLFEDKKIVATLRDHLRKLDDAITKFDTESIDQLRAQYAEFEQRRKSFVERIITTTDDRDRSRLNAISDRIASSIVLELKKLEAALPIYSRRSEIKRSIDTHRVTIVVAETGSGKSTQIPQYVLESIDDQFDETRSRELRILCTQPRKVAAISLAQRVAEELNEQVGLEEVGYRVGGTAGKCKRTTRLVFTTDAFLLRECLKDPLLTKYNYVIVDEAHERSLDTDLALGMLKRCFQQREDTFRVLVMSATINTSLFVDYFNDQSGRIMCNLLTIPGRCYPVTDHWLTDESESALKCRNVADCVVRKVKEICASQSKKDQDDGGGGAILAFLTTPAETEQASRLLESENQRKKMWILQLHGRLQADDQQKVFKACPEKGQRKVVFATNSAETSITIPDVRFVVDSGLVKERRFDAARNTSSLAVGWTSKSSAKQRAGRAGRTAPGECYHLYTEEQSTNEMPDSFIAEIRRTNMSQTLLYLFALQIEDPINFDFIEKPTAESMRNAMIELTRLGALSDDRRSLSEVGRRMSKLSQVEPRLSRFLIWIAENDKAHLKEAIAVACCVSSGNIFFRSGSDDQKNTADVKKVKYCEQAGDPITYLRVFEEWTKRPRQERGRWCADEYINGKCMKAINDLFEEVRHAIIREAQLAIDDDFARPLNADQPGCITTLMKFFTRAYAQNLAIYTGHPRIGYYVPSLKDYVSLHPSSAVFFASTEILMPKWIVFEYMLETSRKFAFDVAVIEEEWLDNGIVDRSILDECRKMVVSSVALNEFGKTAKIEFFKSKQRLEESARRLFDGATCYIDYAQPKDPFYRLILYASSWCLDELHDEARHLIKPIVDELKRDFVEMLIRPEMTTRVCLGPGAEIEEILTYGEYRTVTVRSVPAKRASKEDVIADLGLPMEWIRKCRPFEHKGRAITIDNWGTIGLDTPQHAAQLVAMTNGGEENRSSTTNARPTMVFNPHSAWTNKQEEGFRVSITWSRRPSTGAGVVKLKDESQVTEAIYKLSGNGFAAKRSIKPPPNRNRGAAATDEPTAEPPPAPQDEIYVRNIGRSMNDREFEDVCKNLFATCVNPVEIDRVYLIRKKGFETSVDQLEEYKKSLIKHLEEQATITSTAFALRMLPPRSNGEVEQKAICTITDMNYVDLAAIKLKSAVVIKAISEEEPVKFVGDAREEVTIPAGIFHVVKNELVHNDLLSSEQPQNDLETFVRLNIPTTTMKIETLKSGRIVARIQSTQYRFVTHVRKLLRDILRGDTIDCPPTPLFAALFKPAGVEFVRKLQQKYTVYVNQSYLRQQIVFYGSSSEIAKAKNDLNKHLDELARDGASQARPLFVHPPTYPARTLRTFLAQNQYDVDTIVAAIDGCVSLRFDPGRRRIEYSGSNEGYRRLERTLREIADDLGPTIDPGGDNTVVGVPDCVICFCPVEAKENYCMETCGHYYCKECILGQLKSAVESRTFPIACAEADCGTKFAIKDFENLLRLQQATAGINNDDRQQQQQGNPQQQRQQMWEPIIDASLNAYLAKNSNDYKRCSTPDCAGIYRKTQAQQKFQCDCCGAKSCSGCGLELHEGETCEQYEATKRDNNLLDKWYNEDPANRRPCPKCKAPLEKNGGCQHMNCGSCGIHICWTCMATFETDRETYGHLSSVHGRIQ